MWIRDVHYEPAGATHIPALENSLSTPPPGQAHCVGLQCECCVGQLHMYCAGTVLGKWYGECSRGGGGRPRPGQLALSELELLQTLLGSEHQDRGHWCACCGSPACAQWPSCSCVTGVYANL